MNEFIRDLQRRTSDNINANDTAFYGEYGANEEDRSLPPIGPAFNDSPRGIYDDPEAIHYAQPLEYGQLGNMERDSNHNYSVKNILLEQNAILSNIIIAYRKIAKFFLNLLFVLGSDLKYARK